MNKLIIILWPVSVIAAYMAGSYFVPSDSVTKQHNHPLVTSTSAIDPPASPKQEPTDDDKGVSNSIIKTTPESQAVELSVRSVVKKLEEILSMDGNALTDYAQIAKAYNQISDLDDTQLLEALLLLEPEAKDPDNRALLQMLLSEYSKYDPQGAMAYLDRSISGARSKLLHARKVLANWSEQDPQAAYDWYLQNRHLYRNHGSIFLSTLFEDLSRGDIYDAMDKLGRLNGSRYAISNAVSGITRHLSERSEFVELLELARLQDDEQLNTAIVSNWARKDPHTASNWLMGSRLNSDRMQRSVLFNWMMSSPERVAEAADWYMHQATEADYQPRIKGVMSAFAMNNPEAGLSWLAQNNIRDKDMALTELVAASGSRYPDFAIQQVDQIQSSSQRLKVSKRLYRQLSYNNPNKAERFANSSPFKEKLLEIKTYSGRGL
ncbi:hypothetical protein [Lacimicrobium alkaliphilum]|uniref:Tail length tape measure protein n=1 Tax=Lacimicrobium alkaliphilum TaxID=1526571 RepID=A0ABQ1RBN0_9ALTE|nr:hypothetical protein [Lacimicrobium alkaliphilum]GGD65105.1 hypothetical protein GCM10011357_20560 [Lacimicrobium alkaliphilum]